MVVVGYIGSGKTPYTKELASKSGFKNVVVYDRRKEYDVKKFTIFYSVEYFREFLKTLQDSFIIVEEATGFVAAYKDMEWSDFIVGIEHNRNILCLLFHSIADTPDYVIRNTEFFALFPTYDDARKVELKSSRLFPYFMKERKKNAKGWNIPILVNNKKI